MGSLCIIGGSCSNGLAFSVSGNTKATTANDWFFSYSGGTKAATTTTGGTINIPTGTATDCAIAQPPPPPAAVCEVVTATNYAWTGVHTNPNGGTSSISSGTLNMYISDATGASNSMVFTESTGGYNYKFTSTSIDKGSVTTDPVAKTYAFSGVGNLCIVGGSCSNGLTFSVSGNTKSTTANDFFFSYSGGTKAATATSGGSISIPIGTATDCAVSGRRLLSTGRFRRFRFT